MSLLHGAAGSGRRLIRLQNLVHHPVDRVVSVVDDLRQFRIDLVRSLAGTVGSGILHQFGGRLTNLGLHQPDQLPVLRNLIFVGSVEH